MSLVVFAFPSLQAEPTAAGTLGSLSLQSNSAGIPSLSLSVTPPPFGVPTQVHPSAIITSLEVLSFPSLQAEPTAVGMLGSLSSQSSLEGKPSLSLSIITGPPPPTVIVAFSSQIKE